MSTVVRVGMSSCGLAAGAEKAFKLLSDEVKKRGLDVKVKKCGCLGACYAEPLVEVVVEGQPSVLYGNVTEDAALLIVSDHLQNNRVVPNYVVKLQTEKQLKIVLRNCGIIDPESIEEYISAGGYAGLQKALSLKPDEVIEELKTSGLRGRGGAGYPTWLKWKLTSEAKDPIKYVVCNADEGDPGAYMDRSVLEGDPHSVIEGMIIAAYAAGIHNGFFYIRAEYPLAVERIQKALRQAYAKKYLGKNILGKGFDLEVEVRLGAGAFVCGEETALMASIEGRRGTPHPRPPYPSQKGLWGHPTMINNVETLANVPFILSKGGANFAKVGTEKSKGTKVFAVTGKIKHSGLVEVPMGTSLNTIVFDIAGGILHDKKIKAVQTGGPSGGVIALENLDTGVDYDNLIALGSIMGSGGMIVMDETDCMVDIAKFYLRFCVDESCGKCAPCRIGSYQMLELLKKISRGKGTMEDLENIKEIAVAMQKASLCGLGQTASNPIISTIKHFEEEYQEHIINKRCATGKCKEMPAKPEKK